MGRYVHTEYGDAAQMCLIAPGFAARRCA